MDGWCSSPAVTGNMTNEHGNHEAHEGREEHESNWAFVIFVNFVVRGLVHA
jgi:hypothetical protein